MNHCLHVSRLFLLFVFVLSTIHGHAGTVRGTVKDPLGAVVVNANVELRAGQKTIAGAVTDSEGKFQLNAGQGGRFYLHAMAPTFAIASTDARERFHTRTLWPALTILVAIRDPIVPSPINPTSIGESSMPQ